MDPRTPGETIYPSGVAVSGRGDGDAILDVSGLNCPLPVLKARRRMKELDPGTTLLVRATDPMSRIDIPHFCHVAGYELLHATCEGDTLLFLLRKPAETPL